MAWKAVNVDQALAKIVTTLLLADGCSLLPPPPPPPPPSSLTASLNCVEPVDQVFADHKART